MRNPVRDLVRTGIEPFCLEQAVISQRRGHSRDQHEGFSSIGKAEIAKRDLGQSVAWHMIDENKDQHQSAKKVYPQISFPGLGIHLYDPLQPQPVEAFPSRTRT